MNHNHMSPTRHLVWMLAGGAGLFGLLVLAGVPVTRALPFAALLACPLMMIAMMFMMSRGSQAPVPQDDATKAPLAASGRGSTRSPDADQDAAGG